MPRKQKRDPQTQPARAPQGQPYGEAKAQIDAQQQIPLPQPQQGAPQAAGPSGAAAANGVPYQPVPLFDPTERPDEPITAGLPFGPGAGPPQKPSPLWEAAAALNQVDEKEIDSETKDLRDLLNISLRQGG